MTSAVLRGMRWALAPVAGALAALVVQYVVYRGSLELVYAVVGLQPGEWSWAVKAFTSVFMGGAFVAVVWWVVPSAKRRAALIALGVVAVWGGQLILAGVGEAGTPWLVAMGVLGILGGLAAVLMSRRSLRVA
jgi:hypothetical protein